MAMNSRPGDDKGKWYSRPGCPRVPQRARDGCSATNQTGRRRAGVMANTSNANWRGVYLSEGDADHDLRFDYVRYSATGTGQQILRFTDSNNMLYLEITPTTLFLRQRDGGTLTTLDTYSTTVSEDAWYSARAVLDGANVSVWWGAQGGSFDEVLSTTSATELTTTAASYFRASPSSEHGLDNITLIAGTRSTTQTFTHNDANEQITSTVNGVTTDMAYDEWGRLTERDDGTHTATYQYSLSSITSNFPGEGNVLYQVGGDQRRRSRVAGAEETWYNYTIGFDVVSTENDADGSTGPLTMTNVVSAPTAQVSATLGDLAGTTPASGTARYYATDHLGSIRSAWDVSKATVGGYEFTPYGSVYHNSGTALTLLGRGFTGRPWDSVAMLFGFPYRQYSPYLARWTTRDPLGIVDGLNVYEYVGGNAIGNYDQLGLQVQYGPLWGCLTACGLAVALPMPSRPLITIGDRACRWALGASTCNLVCAILLSPDSEWWGAGCPGSPCPGYPWRDRRG